MHQLHTSGRIGGVLGLLNLGVIVGIGVLAGYPNGENFPVVEYLYNTSDAHKAVAEPLQNMWE